MASRDATRGLNLRPVKGVTAAQMVKIKGIPMGGTIRGSACSPTMSTTRRIRGR